MLHRFPPGASLGTLTLATVPAAGQAGRTAFVSNYGTGGSFLYDTGTRWKPFNHAAFLASLDTPSGNIANTETIVFQYRFPAAMLAVNDRITARISMSKSGSTDTGTLRFRLGTVGDITDQLIAGGTALGAANLSVAVLRDWKVATATTLLALANSGSGSGATSGYSSVVNTTPAAADTISNISNSLFFSVSIFSSSTNDTVALRDAQLSLISSPNA